MKKFNVAVTVICKEIEVTEQEAKEYAELEDCTLEEAYEYVASSKAYDLASDGQWDDLDSQDVQEI